MRQASYDCGLNAYLQRKSLQPQPYRDGVRLPNERPLVATRHVPKPKRADRNRSSLRTMAYPGPEGVDPYETSRWRPMSNRWQPTLGKADWADTQKTLKVPDRWVSINKGDYSDPSKPRGSLQRLC
eukprot:SAG31_NODE_3781_length_3885_cov_3.963286_2_plen_126_part_00